MAAAFLLENAHFQSANTTTDIDNWRRQCVPRVVYKLISINYIRTPMMITYHTLRDIDVTHSMELLHGFTHPLTTIRLFGPCHPFEDRTGEIKCDIDSGKLFIVLADRAFGRGGIQKAR